MFLGNGKLFWGGFFKQSTLKFKHLNFIQQSCPHELNAHAKPFFSLVYTDYCSFQWQKVKNIISSHTCPTLMIFYAYHKNTQNDPFNFTLQAFQQLSSSDCVITLSKLAIREGKLLLKMWNLQATQKAILHIWKRPIFNFSGFKSVASIGRFYWDKGIAHSWPEKQLEMNCMVLNRYKRSTEASQWNI